ncbi:MAG: serine--tRNA ligase [Candidatus Thorarchaeota archaeon SMTZ-45]|nr:MAG: serine--tRNA ligase [Candidatus Thorarchaeota archaeon SMTZ-45]KXH71709.1 MAG: serine--tRNA ligase [Candidatus Thorarchaeota archaeon SMTZ1-45]
MLDIRFIRENIDLIRDNLKRRQDDRKLKEFDLLLKLDEKIRWLKRDIQDLRTQRNKISREIGELKKSGEDDSKLVKKVNNVNKKIRSIEAETNELEQQLKRIQMSIPNILHESVPYGVDEEDNEVLREWGGRPEFDFEYHSHVDLLETLDVGDIPRAARLSGSRFYYLKNELVLLDIAMQQMALEMLVERGFSPIYPPFMMKREPYEGVVDLADFEDVMYKIDGEDLYLIATSEHPMAGMYMGEIFEPTDLPLKLAGVSACFRKEAGSHGKDTKGIFRVHQFNKVEQFVFSLPEDSWNIHEELIKNEEDYVQALNLPYRVVNICTGDMGIVAAKRIDLEFWFPGQQMYREGGSCSNCTAYQATRLNIKYRLKKGGTEKAYLHTLNSTMMANPRTMVAIIENYQKEDGSVEIPKALQKYLPSGIKEIVPQKK